MDQGDRLLDCLLWTNMSYAHQTMPSQPTHVASAVRLLRRCEVIPRPEVWRYGNSDDVITCRSLWSAATTCPRGYYQTRTIIMLASLRLLRDSCIAVVRTA